MGLLAGRKREYQRADLPYYAVDFPPPVDRDVIPHSDGPGVKRLSTIATRRSMHCRRAVYQNFKVFPLSIEAVQHLRSCMGFWVSLPPHLCVGFRTLGIFNAPKRMHLGNIPTSYKTWHAMSLLSNGCTLGASLQSTHLQLKKGIVLSCTDHPG